MPDLSDTAVLISEFGAVALDHQLLEAAADDVVELPNGCTCCAVRQGLADAFYRLLRSRQAAGRPPFRRIALETSGLADPSPTLYTLSADSFLEASLRLDRCRARRSMPCWARARSTAIPRPSPRLPWPIFCF